VILLVTPAPPDSAHGNGVTARRWARILAELGRPAQIAQRYRGGDFAALIALHARKSAHAVRAFRASHPGAPIVIALTGTDLYPDLDTAGVDPEVLGMADRFIVLQREGIARLGPGLAERARVIVQSLPPLPPLTPRGDCFEVAFLAHVRPVKDPLLLPAALRLLPEDSRVRVTHVGEARDADLAAEVAKEADANPRYDWLGPVPRREALTILARSRLLALTSRHEGGANVVSEALAAKVPVVSSAIPGSIGLLGADYPGYFPVGDAGALADMLYAAEHDRDGCYRRLRERCTELHGMVDPAHEKRAFAELLKELELPALR
jgi:putative glycosyltransferase (TIGR04348 family)